MYVGFFYFLVLMELNFSRAIGILNEKLENWLENLIAMLPNLVVALIVLIAFYVLARILKSLFGKLLSKFSDKAAVNNLFTTIIYLVTIGVGLLMALNVLHLQQTVTSILAGAGIIGLALGFAFQDITANFISGVLIAFRKPIQVGDIIEINGFIGQVEQIDLRVTVIRTFQGLHTIIPNKDVFQSPLTNYTRTDDRRIDLEVGVSYGDDLDFVREITLGAVSKVEGILTNQPINLFFKEFGDSSINFVVMFWIHYTSESVYMKSKSEAIMAIKRAYDQNGITIPFPIRTLDFGIKGGKDLSEMKVDTPSNSTS
jgi:small-conductance mechanosensitive channel